MKYQIVCSSLPSFTDTEEGNAALPKNSNLLKYFSFLLEIIIVNCLN